MKTLASGMATMVAGRGRTLEWSVKITRLDGQVFRYVSGSQNATLASEAYISAPGFTVSNITVTPGFTVDTGMLRFLSTSDMVNADFLSGRWKGARVDFNQYDWKTPANGFVSWPFYRVADVQPIVGGFELELRDGRQLWRQDFTLATGKTCQNRLGDTNPRRYCGVNLAPFTFAFTVTSVTSRRVFTASALAQAADYFGNGIVIFNSGLYQNMELQVIEHGTGGVISLGESLYAAIGIGDTGNVIAGCWGRLEDCRDKFDNVLNMRAPGLHAKLIEELVGG